MHFTYALSDGQSTVDVQIRESLLFVLCHQYLFIGFQSFHSCTFCHQENRNSNNLTALVVPYTSIIIINFSCYFTNYNHVNCGNVVYFNTV